jgi:hypothetical protein
MLLKHFLEALETSLGSVVLYDMRWKWDGDTQYYVKRPINDISGISNICTYFNVYTALHCHKRIASYRDQNAINDGDEVFVIIAGKRIITLLL